jgi:hypothetical protein
MAIEMWRSKLYNGGRKGNIEGMDTADVNKKRTYFPLVKRNSHVESKSFLFNPLNAELNPICHLLALLGAHHTLHVSRKRVNFLCSLKTCSKRKMNIIDCFIFHCHPLFELYSLRCTLKSLAWRVGGRAFIIFVQLSTEFGICQKLYFCFEVRNLMETGLSVFWRKDKFSKGVRHLRDAVVQLVEELRYNW